MSSALSGELPNTLGDCNRIRELDGLRGIAIGMVVIFHFFQSTLWRIALGQRLLIYRPATRLSWSGVDLFFVLSGFLIGGHFARLPRFNELLLRFLPAALFPNHSHLSCYIATRSSAGILGDGPGWQPFPCRSLRTRRHGIRI